VRGANGKRDIACTVAAALALTVLLVAGACQEHIPAYALVSDDGAADAAATEDAGADGEAAGTTAD
jgi:hypothetical protein